MTFTARRFARTLTAVAAAGSLALLAGCSSDSDSNSSSAATTTNAATGSCAATTGPLVTAAGQPEIQLPQPAGWERNTSQDSELVRLVLVNTSLTKAGFTPNIVVTVTPSTGTFDEIVDKELAAVRKGMGVEVPAGESGTICGFESYTVTYEASGVQGVAVHPITSRMIVVPTVNGGSSTVVLTVQSTDPTNPTYIADSTAMLDGVQITAG
ncbi:LpqN/LpqT family lipoprotein [Gordonia alkaliphila]|uniref:Lipoprotein LpqN n=1 Tax=Gordonia alkaliphila TaxID=1053547 RepID=A0ABP8ZFT0_9ACTN|nr:LpqN/LpqT family lipoprotein [Gordonia alkaliphila]MCK0438738.1 LpqN/LpqT family lipoprotein [Gordonia alkaliphila]